MDEQNEQQMNFRIEPENGAPAQQEDAPAAPEQDKFQTPDKKTRRKLFALIACMALVAALGGTALTAAIRAISQRNAAEQAALAAKLEAGSESAPDAAPAQPSEKPYTLEKNPLPETLPSNSGSKALTPAEVYAQNAPAVICIETEATQTLYGEEFESGGVGSGFLLTSDGYILTNCHMVTGATTVTVTLYSGESYEATVVGADSMGDVALLKIDAESLPTVSIAEEDTLCVGDEVVAIGNPFGELEYTMTHGYISGLDREITIENTPIRMIQTDTPINSGNSGGPLLDMNGNVVGIASAKYSGTTATGAAIENVSFAIPIHDALEIVYDLQEYGYVRGRAYLGVTVRDLDAQLATDYGLPVGPRVESVTEGSCADKAGIRQGDFILSVSGRETESTSELLAALLRHKAGETVELELFRAGAELTVSVTLDERPQTVEQPSEESPDPDGGN